MPQSNRNPRKNAYLLWHTDNDGDEKLVGVYETRKEASSAVTRIKNKPGFSSPEGKFEITKYQVNKDYWSEGFYRSDGFSLPQWFRPVESKK